MVGKTISHYKILEKLGEGGMGVVYKAQDTKLDRFVALKFLPRHLSQSEEEKQRFIHEAKAASALDHTNICTVYEIDETEDGQMFIAMASYEGESLKEKIERGPMAVNEALDIATQISQGLAKAHSKEIIHRDIKPANLLIAEDDVVKIVDFGLAKLAGRTMLTKEGTTLGTASYMSPEQTEGTEVDKRTDIWALGVVLYEMITGKQPFEGDYEQAVMYSIMHEDPEPLTALRTGLPMELERIVNKALKKSPAERYQSLDEMLVDLKSVRTAESPTGQIPKAVSKGFKPTPTRKWPILLSGFAVVALITIVATFLFYSSQSDSTDIEKSIAVLPFTDMSPSKDQEYFGDGMAEAIINALVGIPGLKVSARTSAFQFKGGENDIQTIGEKLGVATVLEGSVAKSGNTLRITAQLINVADGFHLWSNTYDRELTDIFAIQDDLSRSIVEALEVELSGDKTKTLTKRKPTSVEAYNLYLKGRYFWNRRTGEGLKTSIDYFQQAIDLDPTYALAYAGLADSYNLLAPYMVVSPKEAMPKAKAAAIRALEIDDTLGEAHNSLAFVRRYFDFDWLAAEKGSKRAIELNPNNATAHHWYALYLTGMGQLTEAISEIKRAQDLDPLSLIIATNVGWVYYYARQYDESVEHFKKALEMDPNFAQAHKRISLAYLQEGKCEEAMAELQKAVTLSDGSTNMLTALAYGNAVCGKRQEALEIVDNLREQSSSKYVSSVDIAAIYCALGESDTVFMWLEKAYLERSSRLAYIKVDPKFESLHSDFRFTQYLARMGLEK